MWRNVVINEFNNDIAKQVATKLIMYVISSNRNWIYFRK